MSFVAPTRSRTGPVLPLASMVDIIFLLLIFFMTNSVFRDLESDVPVDLQSAGSASGGTRGQTRLVITITKEEDIYVSDVKHSLESLAKTLAELRRVQPNQVVLIRGDMNSRLGMTIKVMDLAYQVGLNNVFLAASKAPSDIGG